MTLLILEEVIRKSKQAGLLAQGSIY